MKPLSLASGLIMPGRLAAQQQQLEPIVRLVLERVADPLHPLDQGVDRFGLAVSQPVTAPVAEQLVPPPADGAGPGVAPRGS